jgi:hypothetical protein
VKFIRCIVICFIVLCASFLPTFCWVFSLASCFPPFFFYIFIPSAACSYSCNLWKAGPLTAHITVHTKSLCSVVVCGTDHQFGLQAHRKELLLSLFIALFLRACIKIWNRASQKVEHALAHITSWSARDPVLALSMHRATDDVVLYDLCLVWSNAEQSLGLCDPLFEWPKIGDPLANASACVSLQIFLCG